jgi:NADPH:quinone reductase
MSSPTTMRALVLHEFGSDLRLDRLPRPDPGPGEVLVRIKASGSNPLDLKIRDGAAGHAQTRLPAVLGIDMAGVVETVGANVTRFKAGDEVFGMIGGIGNLQGSLADFAAVDANLLALKPTTLTMREAAVLPLAFITAWEGLVDRAKLCDGSTVLVHGGAGGVGHIAVQLAIAGGAKVYATGSASSAPYISDLGATPIDYTATSPEQYVEIHTAGEGFDVAFDTVGGATLDASFTAVRRYTGHVVSALGWGTHSLAPLSFRGASYSGVFTLLPLLTGQGRARHGEILREAAALADNGQLQPLLHPSSYSLDSAQEAHAAVESRGTPGKVVIDLDN